MLKKTLVILLLLLPTVYGIGVSQGLLENNELSVVAGNPYNFQLGLQNPKLTDAQVKVVVDSNIARIQDDQVIFILPAQTYSFPVMIEVLTPKEASIGDIYPLTYTIIPLDANNQELTNQSVSRSFNVVVTSKKPKVLDSSSFLIFPWNLILAFLLVLFGAILMFMTQNSKYKQKPITKKAPIKKVEIVKKEVPPKDEVKSVPKEKIVKLNPEPKVNTSKKITVQNKEVAKPKKDYSKELNNPDEYFYLSNGVTIRSIKHLVEYMRIMPEELIEHHVHDDNNDFANWTEGVFKEIKLANELRKCKTRIEMVKVLDKLTK